MATRHDLADWILESLRALRGEGTVIEVSRDVWQRHETDLRASGDLFFTWQYDIRWEAQKLRDRGILAPANGKRGGKWSLPAER